MQDTGSSSQLQNYASKNGDPGEIVNLHRKHFMQFVENISYAIGENYSTFDNSILISTQYQLYLSWCSVYPPFRLRHRDRKFQQLPRISAIFTAYYGPLNYLLTSCQEAINKLINKFKER